MVKIPFKVSARTARLIGRENIASSKGAIIELVKNSYDADSKICIVYFDNKYSELSETYSQDVYLSFLENNISKELLERSYQLVDDSYRLKATATDEDRLVLKRQLQKLNSLYIIDSGEGMTQQVISDHWMTIGTDNKANNFFTKSGRVKTGAKGIGRFALDKLGNKTQMLTIFDKNKNNKDQDESGNETKNNGYNWKVDWSDFEGDAKTIDTVHANIEGLKEEKIGELIAKYIEDKSVVDLLTKYDFVCGTVLRISELREPWEDYHVDQVFTDLEVLVPPRETSSFSIFLFSALNRNKYGEVLGSVCDDYDYKLVAEADDKQNISITIYRNEYDVELIDPALFDREEMQKTSYTLENFKRGSWTINKSFSELLPGFEKVDEDHVFQNIGKFDFTLYFMKKTYTTADAEKFYYQKFRANERKAWLGKFAGVKLFRDNFRVRPYGEVKNSAFDWLGLGSRKASSPAGISKKEGGYRVNPENISGAIHISRLTNVAFEDKSSREGLQESKTFLIFSKIIESIIKVFEDDRAYIAREMNNYYNEKNAVRIDKEKAEELADKILEENRKKKESPEEETSESSSNEIVLAQLNEEKSEEIEKLKDEQKVLRGMASSGIVMASFSHDLSKLNNVLSSRIDKLRELISVSLSETSYAGTEDRKNPFKQLERMKKQDLKLQNWLKFSLGAARKDKRRRKNLFFDEYFNTFAADWKNVLETRGIKLDNENVSHLGMRVFEIDIDSIFNNLLVNSVDAFIASTIDRSREISIAVSENDRELIIDYHDTGPGLSTDIRNPEDIFNPLFTTKRNKYTGDEEGTGLGMWLVKSIVKDNDGSVRLLYPEEGFGIRISFPIKYRRS